MRYSYILTYKDYKDAQVLYRRHRWTATLSYYAWVWLLPVAGLIVGIPLLLNPFGFQPEWMSSIAAFSAVGLWFALFIPVMRFYGIRKCWRKMLPDGVSKSVKTELAVELEMTDQQIVSILPGKSEGRFFWSAIPDYTEDDRLALVFVKKKLFLFIPRRALPDEAWLQLRTHIANRGLAA